MENYIIKTLKIKEERLKKLNEEYKKYENQHMGAKEKEEYEKDLKKINEELLTIQENIENAQEAIAIKEKNEKILQEKNKREEELLELNEKYATWQQKKYGILNDMYEGEETQEIVNLKNEIKEIGERLTKIEKELESNARSKSIYKGRVKSSTKFIEEIRKKYNIREENTAIVLEEAKVARENDTANVQKNDPEVQRIREMLEKEDLINGGTIEQEKENGIGQGDTERLRKEMGYSDKQKDYEQKQIKPGESNKEWKETIAQMYKQYVEEEADYIYKIVIEPGHDRALAFNHIAYTNQIENAETENIIESLNNENVKYDEKILRNLAKSLKTEQLEDYVTMCKLYSNAKNFSKEEVQKELKNVKKIPKIYYDLTTLRKKHSMRTIQKLELIKNARYTQKMYNFFGLQDKIKVKMNILDRGYFTIKGLLSSLKYIKTTTTANNNSNQLKQTEFRNRIISKVKDFNNNSQLKQQRVKEQKVR